MRGLLPYLALGLGVAIAYFFGPLTLFGNSAIKIERHVIVIGGGAAGLAAAIEAVKAGAKVTIVDKEARMGGNSAKASSGVNGADTKFQRQQGIKDTVADFMKDTMLSGGGISDHHLVRALAEDSAPAIDFLGDLGINMSLIIQCGGHAIPRTHRHVTQTGKKPQNAGMEIIGSMMSFLEQNGDKVTFLTGTKANRLLKDAKNNRVYGVEIVNLASMATSVLNGTAVVLSTGGFGASKDMLKRFTPAYAHLPTTNGNFAQGEGIALGEEVGAAITQMENVQVHPTGFVDPKDVNNPVKWLAPEALRGSGGLLLGADGRRFVNELGYRDQVTRAIFEHGKKLQTPTSNDDNEDLVIPASAVMVLNEAASQIFPLPPIYKIKGFVRTASNSSDLAQQLGVDPKIIEQTLNEYTASAAKGKDQFGKVTFPVTFTTTETLYWMEVTPSVHYTMGGLVIDHQSNVLGTNNQPIKSFFACGEVTGGLHGKNRLAGNGILDNVVFGRRAGKNAAKQQP